MKTIVFWFLLAAAVLGIGSLLPFQSRDVGQLVPVETLVISLEEDQIQLNGGICEGKGKTWETAWQDLQDGAPGYVFLGTAEQVVFVGGAMRLLQQVAEANALRPAAHVCVSVGQKPKPEAITPFLRTHNSGLTLQQVRAAFKQGRELAMPVLEIKEGEMHLYEP